MRYFVCISYNGSRYHGWQKQNNSSNTVQGQIERVLHMLFQIETDIIGCGRTDTGVHASGYYFHFDAPNDLDVAQLKYKLNSILPEDIVVHAIYPVPPDAHARFDAISRKYVYRLKTERDPLDVIHFYYKYGEPNLTALNRAAALLVKYHDFGAYAKTHSDVKTTLCTITNAHWIQEATCYEFHITANRFLRGMIRLLVGMMLNYERGKLTLDDIVLSLEKGEVLPIQWSVPADGLILKDIQYKEGILPTHTADNFS